MQKMADLHMPDPSQIDQQAAMLSLQYQDNVFRLICWRQYIQAAGIGCAKKR